jgi:general control protein GCN4
MSTATTNQSASFLETASAATLFELFDAPMSSQEFTGSAALAAATAAAASQPPLEQREVDNSKPRQILGESVFNQFVEAQTINDEFPLGFIKLETPELSPSVGTVSPYELHSSIVESIFSPTLENSTPMFEDFEMDSSEWKPLFEPSEMEIPAVPETTVDTEVVSNPVATTISTAPPYTSPVNSTMNSPSEEAIQNFTTCSTASSKKRSFSDAEFQSSTAVKRSSPPSSSSSSSRRESSQLLTPMMDSSDPTAAKRARNTEAARRSRARKMERMNVLEDKVEELTQKNTALEDEVSRLRAMLAAVGR